MECWETAAFTELTAEAEATSKLHLRELMEVRARAAPTGRTLALLTPLTTGCRSLCLYASGS